MQILGSDPQGPLCLHRLAGSAHLFIYHNYDIDVGGDDNYNGMVCHSVFLFLDTGCVHVRRHWLSKAMSALKKKHRCENQCFFSPQFINHHHLTTLPMVSYHVIITISSQSIMITIDRSLACVLLQGIATKALTVSIIGREGITGDGEGSSCLW